jgi:hypothetical protein
MPRLAASCFVFTVTIILTSLHENHINLFTLASSAHQSSPSKVLMNGNQHNDNRSRRLTFLDPLREQYAHQLVFLQTVEEMAHSLLDSGIFDDPRDGEFYRRAFVAMTEPERVIAFRVPWTDDAGNLRFNRGWRVEFNRYACDRTQHWHQTRGV